LFVGKINGQFCGFDEIFQQQMQIPNFQQYNQENENELQQFLNSNTQNLLGGNIMIPVIFQIIHLNESNGADNNISSDQIDEALKRLKADFKNTGIDFCLALRDGNGQDLDEDGIVRLNGTGVSNYEASGMTPGLTGNELDIKLLATQAGYEFSNYNYLKIWVVSNIVSTNSNGQVAGFAYFPGMVLDDALDGITIDNQFLGLNNYKILTHEVGHYLRLYHTFEGDDDGNSCPSTDPTLGDMVAQTDPHIRTGSFLCTIGPNPCANGDPLENVIHNHMNYADEDCRTEFKGEQVTRMLGSLMLQRPGLQDAIGCTPSCNLTVGYTHTPENPMTNQICNFIGSVQQSGSYTYRWLVNGVDVPNNTSQNFEYAFPDSKKYTVCFRVTNNAGLCVDEKCQDVVVFSAGLCYTPESQCELVRNGDFETFVPSVSNPYTFGTLLHDLLFESAADLKDFKKICNWYNAQSFGRVFSYLNQGSNNYVLSTESQSGIGATGYATASELNLVENNFYKLSFDLAVKTSNSNTNLQEFYFGLINVSDLPNSFSDAKNFNHI
jgi:hypothetical protein